MTSSIISLNQYRAARGAHAAIEAARASSAHMVAASAVRSGVGGWLMLLVLQAGLLAPECLALWLQHGLHLAEGRWPVLASAPTWLQYKQVCWAMVASAASCSGAAALVLGFGRARACVWLAISLLWAAVAMASIGLLAIAPQSVGLVVDMNQVKAAFTWMALPVGIWTVYLLQSRRVRVTYC